MSCITCEVAAYLLFSTNNQSVVQRPGSFIKHKGPVCGIRWHLVVRIQIATNWVALASLSEQVIDPAVALRVDKTWEAVCGAVFGLSTQVTLLGKHDSLCR